MKATNLDLIGENRWGQMTRRHIYSDDSGQMCVRVPLIGTLRCKTVPYRQYANDFLEYSYIMERRP